MLIENNCCVTLTARIICCYSKILSTNTHYIPEECTAFKAQWLLYVPAGLTLKNSTFFQQYALMCFVQLQKQRASISLTALTDWILQ